MINNNYQPAINFQGRSLAVKKADSICRRVKREFPVFSSEKASRSKVLNNDEKSRRILGFYREITGSFVSYFKRGKTPKRGFYREVLGMKKNKLGNSNEMADVTLMALKMNGYPNAKKVALYAYNPEKHQIRDLRYSTVVTDLTKSKDYRPFNPQKDHFMRSKHLIFPEKLENKNELIFVDSMAGFADYTQGAKNKYRYDKISSFKLEPEEKIGFVIKDSVPLNGKDMNYLEEVFPALKTDNPIDMKGRPTLKKGLSTSKINKYRMEYEIEPKDHMHSHRDRTGMIYPPKETFFEKFIQKIKKMF